MSLSVLPVMTKVEADLPEASNLLEKKWVICASEVEKNVYGWRLTGAENLEFFLGHYECFRLV